MDRRRLAAAAASVVVLFVLAAASLEQTTPGNGAFLVPVPDEGCTEATRAPGSTPGPGQAESCEGAAVGSGGAGGGAIASVLPLVGLVVAAVLVIALTGAAFVLRVPPRMPPEPVEGWWTCPVCGGNNLAESPRCHRCGAWPPASQARPRGRISS